LAQRRRKGICARGRILDPRGKPRDAEGNRTDGREDLQALQDLRAPDLTAEGKKSAAPSLSSVPTRRGLDESVVGDTSAFSSRGSGDSNTNVSSAGSGGTVSCTVGPESCSVRRRLERERIDGDANQIGCGAGPPPGDRADRAARGGGDRLLLEAGRHGRAGAALVALGGSGASLLCDCGAAHLACPTTE